MLAFLGHVSCTLLEFFVNCTLVSLFDFSFPRTLLDTLIRSAMKFLDMDIPAPLTWAFRGVHKQYFVCCTAHQDHSSRANARQAAGCTFDRAKRLGEPACRKGQVYEAPNEYSAMPPNTNGSRPKAAAAAGGRSDSPDEAGSSVRLKHLFLPCLLPTVFYLNSLHGDFVHDDIPAIVRNPDVTGASSLSNLLYTDYWGERLEAARSHKSYRPLTIATFRLTARLAGLSPVWYHGGNLLLHCWVSCCLFLVCRKRLDLGRNTATLASILFSLHPVHTEAVSGIVGRAELLSCLFMLASFYVFTTRGNTSWQAGTNRKMALTATSYLLAILALMSKETGITVMGINVVFQVLTTSCCYYQSRRLRSPAAVGATNQHKSHLPVDAGRYGQQSEQKPAYSCPTHANCSGKAGCMSVGSGQLLRYLACHVAAVGLVVVFRLHANRNSPQFSAGDNPASFHARSATRWMTHVYVAVFHVHQLLCPSVLSYDWQMGSLPLVHRLTDRRNLYSGMVLGFMALLALRIICQQTRAGGQRKALTFSILFLVLPFVPASNLFFPVGFVAAERVLYVPSVGWSVLVALGAERAALLLAKWLWPLQAHRGGDSIAASLLENSFQRHVTTSEPMPSTNKQTKSFFQLPSGSLAKTTVKMLMAVTLLSYGAKTYTRNFAWTSRVSLFKSGLASTQSNAKVFYNYANYERDQGNLDVAKLCYREAIRLWPSYVIAWNNLATVVSNETEIERLLRVALWLEPGHPSSLYNLGDLYRQQGNCPLAIYYFTLCLQQDACKPEAVSMMASCQAALDRLNTGSWHFKNANVVWVPAEAIAHLAHLTSSGSFNWGSSEKTLLASLLARDAEAAVNSEAKLNKSLKSGSNDFFDD